MRDINVERRPAELAEYRHRQARNDDYHTLLTTPFRLFEDGELKLAYVELTEPMHDVRLAVDSIKYQETARTGGMKTRSRVFGHQPRITIRRDYCTATALRRENPKAHTALTGAATLVAREYRKHNAALYEKHDRLSAENLKDQRYRMGQTAFTSGIVNDSNPLHYHLDAGNYPGVWSGMLLFKSNIAGGILVLPEFGIGIDMRDRSLLLFDGQGIIHGVTAIERLGANAYRRSIVYYSLAGMWKCEPIEAEAERIQRLRTQREDKRAGR